MNAASIAREPPTDDPGRSVSTRIIDVRMQAKKVISPPRSSYYTISPGFGQLGMMVGASPQQQRQQQVSSGISSACAGAGVFPDAFGNNEMLNYMYCMPWCMISSPLEPMIKCDNDQCGYGEWFHYSCVGIDEAPPGRWYCTGCHPSNTGVPFNPGVIVRRSPRSYDVQSDFGTAGDLSSSSSNSSLAVDLMTSSSGDEQVHVVVSNTSKAGEDTNAVADKETCTMSTAVLKVEVGEAAASAGYIAQSLSDEERSAGHDGGVTTSTFSDAARSAAARNAIPVRNAAPVALMVDGTRPAAAKIDASLAVSLTAAPSTTLSCTSTAIDANDFGQMVGTAASRVCAGGSVRDSDVGVGSATAESTAAAAAYVHVDLSAAATSTSGASSVLTLTSTSASALLPVPAIVVSMPTGGTFVEEGSASDRLSPVVARPSGTSGKCLSTTGAMVIGGDATLIGQKIKEGGGKPYEKFMKVVASVEAETERAISGGTREIFVRDHFFKQRKGGGRREQHWEDSLMKYGDEKLAKWSSSMVDAAYADARRLLRDMGEDSSEFVLQACSMLCSGPDAEGQVPHYDLAEGCYQFIVALTENAAPTLVLGPSTLLLKDKAASRQTELSGEDAAARVGLDYDEQTTYVRNLLDTFSDLALPRDLLEWRMTPLVPNDDWAPRKSGRKVSWSAGTMSGMRADVIHAGPPTTAHRIVLFFVACKGTITYDADFQVNPFNFPLYLNSMCPNATLDFCGMYQDHKPWDYLGDQLDWDGVQAVKEYVQGKISKRKAFKQLATSLANLEKKRKKKERSRRQYSKSRSDGGGRPKKRRAKAKAVPPALTEHGAAAVDSNDGDGASSTGEVAGGSAPQFDTLYAARGDAAVNAAKSAAATAAAVPQCSNVGLFGENGVKVGP